MIPILTESSEIELGYIFLFLKLHVEFHTGIINNEQSVDNIVEMKKLPLS
jgi:hypothetical protein